MPRVPVFPLGTVLFPGSVTGLHIFEARYVAMVEEVLAITDPAERLIGITAIREGYEVAERFQPGAESTTAHQFATAHRVGTLVQLTSVVGPAEGRYDIEVTGRERFRVGTVDPTGPFLRAEIALLPDVEDTEDNPARVAQARAAAVATYARYRDQVLKLQHGGQLPTALPEDPTYLSYTLAAGCLFTLIQRQRLLEAESARERLELVDQLMRAEIRAMGAVPSLPAIEVSRNSWSPN